MCKSVISLKIGLLLLLSSLLVMESPLLFGQSTAQVKTGRPAAWVQQQQIDEAAIPPEGQESSYYYLLLDKQENIEKQEDYRHFAYKILTNEGLQEMSDISIDFDPSYEELVIHHITILRDGKRINQLPNPVRTVQREESMDRHLYDGSLTAVINLTGVRIGDIVEYAYTRKGYNPVYDGHSVSG